MKIYICIPEKFLRHENSPFLQENIRSSLRTGLKKFYRWYRKLDIEFWAGSRSAIDVYIMGDTARKYSGAITEIHAVIENSIHTALDCVSNPIPEDLRVSIRLSYQRLSPHFHPSLIPPEPEPSESSSQQPQNSDALKEFDYEQLAINYHAEEPRYSFSRVILPESVMSRITEALALIQVEAKVLDEWGMRKIIPFAACALLFYGPPGTGKTMTAEAIASRMHRKIIRATYADLTSKYKGQSQKMIKAVFLAAEKQNAVLFIDDSEALLSRRSADAGDSSAESSNAMKSQMLILLEQFSGIVIFATNMPLITDNAFRSRLITIKFTNPEPEARKGIWKEHIQGEGIKIPLAEDVDTSELADKYDFCGRDIKKAALDACVNAAKEGKESVAQSDFIRACEKIREETQNLLGSEDYTGTEKQPPQLSEGLQKVIRKNYLTSS